MLRHAGSGVGRRGVGRGLRRDLLLLAQPQAALEGLDDAGLGDELGERREVGERVEPHALEEQAPGRFLLGLGVSHGMVVEWRGHAYRKPVEAMRDYLTAMRDWAYQGQKLVPLKGYPGVVWERPKPRKRRSDD